MPGRGDAVHLLDPGTTHGIQMTMQSYLGKCRFQPVHAAPMRQQRESLTKPMQQEVLDVGV